MFKYELAFAHLVHGAWCCMFLVSPMHLCRVLVTVGNEIVHLSINIWKCFCYVNTPETHSLSPFCHCEEWFTVMNNNRTADIIFCREITVLLPWIKSVMPGVWKYREFAFGIFFSRQNYLSCNFHGKDSHSDREITYKQKMFFNGKGNWGKMLHFIEHIAFTGGMRCNR